MPVCQINVNVKEEDIPSTFLADLHVMFQKVIDKPDKYILIHLHPAQLMSFGGTSDPCALVKVESIGKLGLEENKTITQAITAELAKIGIPADRMYVLFKDLERQDAGWNNTTFAR